MARRIPPPLLPTVAATAFDLAAAEREATDPTAPPQARWAQAPERYRQRWIARTDRIDDTDDDTGIPGIVARNIRAAIVQHVGPPGQGAQGAGRADR